MKNECNTLIIFRLHYRITGNWLKRWDKGIFAQIFRRVRCNISFLDVPQKDYCTHLVETFRMRGYRYSKGDSIWPLQSQRCHDNSSASTVHQGFPEGSLRQFRVTFKQGYIRTIIAKRHTLFRGFLLNSEENSLFSANYNSTIHNSIRRLWYIKKVIS